MKLLILGGTVFLGRHLVEAALERGHEVTLFNRGQSSQSSPDGVELILGNRDGNLEGLKGRNWDTVIDTSGYVPRIVRESAELLKDQVHHYTFISSISVYPEFRSAGADESSPVGVLEDETSEDVSKHYGELKALCERTVEEVMPGRALHIRPGLIVGPYDKTDRFTYWPTRVHAGGEVLTPGNQCAPVQVIHARDLADWTLDMIERGKVGVYNATGPQTPLTMKEFLDACRKATGSDATFTWVDDAFLLEQGLGPWMEMPLWIPPIGETESMAHMMAVNVDKAVDAGLTFRPIEQTIQETLEWDLTRPAETPRRAGLAAEKEQAILRAWHEAQ